MKTQILAAIGETALQPAASLNAALAANDRIKYALSLLQLALTYAEHPEQPASTLKAERAACGIDDPDLDAVIGGARMVGKSCRVPNAARIFEHIAADMRLMAAPVLAGNPNGLAPRLDGLLNALPAEPDGLLDPKTISAMMQAGHDGPDSLHRLVMDLHKRLNTMQGMLAEEMLHGAAVYNLAETDRPLVTAFMSGLNRTAKLKFNHPGLATTATRADGRLVIQNDIGTTDAHVIVIHVQELTVSVTYTDVHPERLAFFQSMLKPRAVIWEKEGTALLAAGAAFYVAAGHLESKDVAHCCDYLGFLGSRLVFLIDWNRARKQCRGFLRGPDRLALLSWAAETETGHRGFLELGGERLVNQAIEVTAGSSMHFGDRLCSVLGDAESIKFMRFVFQAATEGLLSGQSQALIQDRIRVTLAADDTADELEDAAFLLELDTLTGKPLEALQALADLLLEASQEWIKALGHAIQIGQAANSLETEDFVSAIDRIATLERQADDAERTLAAMALRHAENFRQLHLFTAIGNKLEAAADALKHASLILREHVLEDVIDG